MFSLLCLRPMYITGTPNERKRDFIFHSRLLIHSVMGMIYGSIWGSLLVGDHGFDCGIISVQCGVGKVSNDYY